MDQRIHTPYFTAWVHNIWIEQNVMLYPFSVTDTWALHYWLARKIPAVLDQGNVVMVDDCTLFYLTAAEYTAWPIIGNAVSFHINFTSNSMQEYASNIITGQQGVRLSPKNESRLINPVPFSLNPVTYRIIKRVLTCPFKSTVAEIYQARNCKNLLDIYLHQLVSETGHFRLLYSLRQVLLNIREYAQYHPDKFTAYEEVAKANRINVDTLRTGFENYFHTPLHTYVLQEKLNTAFHLLASSGKQFFEISRMVGYKHPHFMNHDFEQYFGYPMDYIRGKAMEK